MEEKIIIKSERYNIKKIFLFALILGLVSLLVFFLVFDINEVKRKGEHFEALENNARRYEEEGEFIFGDYYGDPYYYNEVNYESDIEVLGEYGSAFMYGLCNMDFNFMLQILCFIAGPQLIALIIYLWLKSYELTITDKRAYGRAAFGKRVDLPIDSVTAIALGWLKAIKITTPSGGISFKLIKNRDEMYKVISDLIIERQSKAKQETVVKQEFSQSNADELKKYKDLLDSGVITEEEFNAKKKQLLGL